MNGAQNTIPTMMLVPADQFNEMTGLIRNMAVELSDLKKAVSMLNPPKQEDEGGFKTQDAAKYIGVSVQHLRKNLKDEIGYVQRKRSMIFAKADLDEFKKRYKVDKRIG